MITLLLPLKLTKTTNLPSLLAYTTTPELPRVVGQLLEFCNSLAENKPKEDAKGGSTNLDANAEANVTSTTKDVKVDANGKSGVPVSSNAFATGSAQESPRYFVI